MSLSLPASHISFNLYEACAFEAAQVLGPQVDENEGVLFDDSALSGPSVAPPQFCGTITADYTRMPDQADIRWDYGGFDTFDLFKDSLDATGRIPRGSVTAGPIHSCVTGDFFHGHACCWRL